MPTIPLPVAGAKPYNPAFSLATIQMAAPCHAEWAQMPGDEKARFCGECRKNVYNLSAMTAPEAEALIQATEGKLCATFFRRADGTVLTQDCPVGVRARLRAAWARSVARVAAAAVLGLSFFGLGCKARGGGSAIGLEKAPPPPICVPGGISFSPPPPGVIAFPPPVNPAVVPVAEQALPPAGK